MANTYFQFKQFTIHQDQCAMKVTTDACLFGAWCAERVGSSKHVVQRILDIGSGTGLLSLMLAQKVPLAGIESVEFDREAYEQAKENIAASRWPDSIKVIHGDAKIYSFPNKYRVIISNPPFYEKELKAGDRKKNMARHDEGLLLPELLDIIKQELEPDGRFYLLLPYKRNEEARELLLNKELDVLEIIFVRQSVDHDYFRIMIEGQLKKTTLSQTMISEISIRDANNAYTPEFIQLLKDYYLHL